MKPSNLLKIETLTDQWLDKDVIILHACFQLLSDCIEKENLLNGHIDWSAKEDSQKAKNEIELLHHWWIHRKTKTEELGEKQYEEDNQMLKKLIDIRKYLWT